MKSVKTLLYILIAAGLIGGAIYIIKNNKAKQEEEVAIVNAANDDVVVKTIKANFQSLNTDYTSNGTFAPFQEMNVRIVRDEFQQTHLPAPSLNIDLGGPLCAQPAPHRRPGGGLPPHGVPLQTRRGHPGRYPHGICHRGVSHCGLLPTA